MTQLRRDLPYNFDDDWGMPEFLDGELAELAMQEGERIIASQRALLYSGVRDKPDVGMLKRGIACYRLGFLFRENRAGILDLIRRDRRRAEG